MLGLLLTNCISWAKAHYSMFINWPKVDFPHHTHTRTLTHTWRHFGSAKVTTGNLQAGQLTMAAIKRQHQPWQVCVLQSEELGPFLSGPTYPHCLHPKRTTRAIRTFTQKQNGVVGPNPPWNNVIFYSWAKSKSTEMCAAIRGMQVGQLYAELGRKRTRYCDTHNNWAQTYHR